MSKIKKGCVYNLLLKYIYFKYSYFNIVISCVSGENILDH